MFQLTLERFDTLMKSGVLKKQNHERCVRIFYDAAKIIHYRQGRLDKDQLRMNQIAAALTLVEFYHSSMFRFVSSGPLACNFPDCPEDRAIAYFGNSVTGIVADAFGRKVEIEDGGMRSLYKDQHTGKHAVAAENYEPIRGKRLPWIRHTLCNTKSIFQAEATIHGKFRRSYLYSSLTSIPLAIGPADSYFVVVVVEDPNGHLRFVTAYPIDRHNKFLKRIEECTPFVGK
jgi:hypothetical protein